MKPKKKPATKKKLAIQGMIGVGFDADDGEKRITRTEEMLLVGGSEETHEKMQETAIKFSESLEKKGKKLPELSITEARDLLFEAIEKAK